MSMAQNFNTAAAAPVALQSSQTLGQELLALTMRKRDGASENRDLIERAIEMVDHNADLTVTDNEQERNALMWASYFCRARIVEAILKKAPESILQQDKDGKTALDLAREKKQKPAIALLEKASADYKQKILEEAEDIATKRDTVVRKPLRFKKRDQGRDNKG